jgi:hypothetical protein
MSRSYKKSAVIKDGGHEGKKRFNQNFRSKNKIHIRLGLEPKLPNEVENQYNLCDWGCRFEKSHPDYKVRKRK